MGASCHRKFLQGTIKRGTIHVANIDSALLVLHTIRESNITACRIDEVRERNYARCEGMTYPRKQEMSGHARSIPTPLIGWEVFFDIGSDA